MTQNPTSLGEGGLGCAYTGHEFGASYPDSVCIDGYLWDADSGDDDGLTHGGDLACPRCNTAAFLAHFAEDATSAGYGMGGPWAGAAQFERAAAKALSENPESARAALLGMPTFEALDWPNREAVYQGRARWDETIDVTVTPADLARATNTPEAEGGAG